METRKWKLAEATSSQFPISSFQFPFFPYPTPASIGNLQSTIANIVVREPPLRQKAPPEKTKKTLDSAFFWC